jgi:hypothetical protein
MPYPSLKRIYFNVGEFWWTWILVDVNLVRQGKKTSDFPAGRLNAEAIP